MLNKGEIIMKCAECGKTCISDELIDTKSGKVCEECRDNHFVLCDNCGKYVNQMDTEYDSRVTVCLNCFEDMARCHCCKEIFPIDEITIINDLPYCENCKDDNFVVCDDCGEYIDRDNAMYIDSDDTTVCSCCFEDNYISCYECGTTLSMEHAQEYNDEYYCEECYHRVAYDHIIHEYDYQPEYFNFSESENRNKKLHIGIELELEFKDIEDRNHICDYIDDNVDDVYIKYDGSLDRTGIEIVSHPFTYQEIKKHFKRIYNELDNVNVENDLIDCGLHFHIDKEYLDEKTIQNIDYIVNEFSSYFEKIGGRKFNSYCDKQIKSLNRYGMDSGSRYLAVNLRNRYTVELRFCKATSDYYTFLDRVNTIFQLVEFAKNHSFAEITKYDEKKFIEEFD